MTFVSKNNIMDLLYQETDKARSLLKMFDLTATAKRRKRLHGLNLMTPNTEQLWSKECATTPSGLQGFYSVLSNFYPWLWNRLKSLSVWGPACTRRLEISAIQLRCKVNFCHLLIQSRSSQWDKTAGVQLTGRFLGPSLAHHQQYCCY